MTRWKIGFSKMARRNHASRSIVPEERSSHDRIHTRTGKLTSKESSHFFRISRGAIPSIVVSSAYISISNVEEQQQHESIKARNDETEIVCNFHE